MKPIEHAKIHARKYGGKPEDYVDIDDLLDSSKAAHGTMNHRAIYHHTVGAFLVERIFGHERINSDDKPYSPRQVAEDHIIQDLGWLPTPDHYLRHMETQAWFGNPISKKTRVKLVD